MSSHVVDVQTQPIDPACAAHGLTHRWQCSCGRIGPWRIGDTPSDDTRVINRMRDSGSRHVAAVTRRTRTATRIR
jgi:hypothetical protein